MEWLVFVDFVFPMAIVNEPTCRPRAVQCSIWFGDWTLKANHVHSIEARALIYLLHPRCKNGFNGDFVALTKKGCVGVKGLSMGYQNGFSSSVFTYLVSSVSRRLVNPVCFGYVWGITTWIFHWQDSDVSLTSTRHRCPARVQGAWRILLTTGLSVYVLTSIDSPSWELPLRGEGYQYPVHLEKLEFSIT